MVSVTINRRPPINSNVIPIGIASRELNAEVFWLDGIAGRVSDVKPVGRQI
jgi:hypothetical protein